MDIKEIKELIADERFRIKLHEWIRKASKGVIEESSEDNIPIERDWSADSFEKKINKYEDVLSDLCSAQILIAYWGNKSHSRTLVLPFRMIADYWEKKSGRSAEYTLPWYNNLLLLYYIGIAAIASKNYQSFKSVTDKSIPNPIRPDGRTTLLQANIDICRKFKDKFQLISGEENHKVPRSEYLFKTLQPKIEKRLYLGSDYEYFFDRFEILMALEYAHQTADDSPEYISVPIGRFGYKRRGNDNPLADLIEEANDKKEDWPPLKAGLIGGSFDRFKEISDLLVERLNKPGWGF